MLLDEIVANKRAEIAYLTKAQFDATLLDHEPIDFALALNRNDGRIAVIAEMKKASPSAGLLLDTYVPEKIAAIYETAGASAISVLTDNKYFQGSIAHLMDARAKTKLPILRKDFIIDELQLLESRAAGADAVLLIARILDDEKLKQLYDRTYELGMQALVEVRNAGELERALELNAQIIGINNRDLDTLQTDLETTVDLMDDYPELLNRIVVSESGIEEYEQIEMLLDKGVKAVLVGEAILTTEPLGIKIKELSGDRK